MFDAQQTAKALPLRYQGGCDYDRGQEREVALFILRGDQPRYHCRGSLSEAVPVATYGFRAWRGGAVTDPVETLRFVIDESTGAREDPERDRRDLCWGGEFLTAEEFLAYWEAVR